MWLESASIRLIQRFFLPEQVTESGIDKIQGPGEGTVLAEGRRLLLLCYGCPLRALLGFLALKIKRPLSGISSIQILVVTQLARF
jgi:hypothetical protein